jgi:hypothetical protein
LADRGLFYRPIFSVKAAIQKIRRRRRFSPSCAVVGVLATRLQVQIAEAPVFQFLAEVLDTNLFAKESKHRYVRNMAYMHAGRPIMPKNCRVTISLHVWANPFKNFKTIRDN